MLSPLVAGALSAAIVAGVTVWTFAQLPGLWVWAAFVGWASYDNSGADRKALFTSSTRVVFGAVMAWLVALVLQRVHEPHCGGGPAPPLYCSQ
jgi:hypothetical protein